MLTGCSTSVSVSDVAISSAALGSDMNLGYTQEKGLYINDEMKKVILEINKLNDEYLVNDNEWRYDYLYIDIDHNLERIKDSTIGNKRDYQDGYFDELIKILDKGLAEGLEEYILEMEDKNLESDEVIIEKIGRTVVYVQNRGRNEENDINIKINFLDVENEYYKDVFDRVSNGKYILDNLVMGEKLNLMEFVNLNNSHYRYDYTNVDIRYNMFFQEQDIVKVNILIQRNKLSEIKDEDMEVFMNLLNSLELKEGEKDLLVKEYKNLFDEKLSNKKINLDNYKLTIKANKGRLYSGKDKDRELIYFSIERH